MQDSKDDFAGPPEEKSAINVAGIQGKVQFNLDDWKREICNNPDKQQAIAALWEDFDEEEWSLWKIHYNKDEEEGIHGFLTNNLKHGILQRLENLRATCFASLGVYGYEGDYQIDGIWLWKGTQIAVQWENIQSFEYFSFEKLDPKNPPVWQLAKEYWLNTNQGDLVEGKPVYSVTWFK